MGIFIFFFSFLEIVSATFLVSSHTLSNSFRLCKVKKVGLKFVTQNVTLKYEKNLSGAKLPLRSIDY